MPGKKTEIKMIITGSKASGKTSLHNRLFNPASEFDKTYQTTIGVNFKQHQTDGNPSLRCWDLASQNRAGNIDGLRDAYYRNADIILYCVDLTETFNAEQIETDLRRIDDAAQKEQMVIFVATKCDLVEEEKEETVNSTAENIKDLVQSIGELEKINICQEVIQTSAKNGDGMDCLESKLEAIVVPVKRSGSGDYYHSEDSEEIGDDFIASYASRKGGLTKTGSPELQEEHIASTSANNEQSSCISSQLLIGVAATASVIGLTIAALAITAILAPAYIPAVSFLAATGLTVGAVGLFSYQSSKDLDNSLTNLDTPNYV